jgi:tRNA(Ile)-lysidine synthetase-like protein
LCALATALHHQSRAEEALPVLQEAEALQLRIAPSHPKMAVILNDLGVLQARLGRREEADATMLRAVERHEAIYGATHPQTLRTRGNRASLLRAFRGPAVSAREYERVLPAAREAFGGSGHAQLVNMLAQLAVSLDEAGEGDKALLAAREAWDGRPLELPAAIGSLTLAANPDHPNAPITPPLRVRFRRGGESLRLNEGGYRRDLRDLFQEAGIPPWQRSRLPMVFSADDELLAVADLWTSDRGRAHFGMLGRQLVWDTH